MTLPLTNKIKLITCTRKRSPSQRKVTINHLRVRYYQQVSFRVLKEMNRSNPWAGDWLKRYDKEGTGGLKYKQKKAVDIQNYLQVSGTRYRLPPQRKQPGLDDKA